VTRLGRLATILQGRPALVIALAAMCLSTWALQNNLRQSGHGSHSVAVGWEVAGALGAVGVPVALAVLLFQLVMWVRRGPAGGRP
jgi:hypothetical protein